MFIFDLFRRKKLFRRKNKTTIQTPEAKPEITPVPFPEGAEIDILYMHYCGMAMGSHYILKRTDKGVFMKISTSAPDSYEMTKDITYIQSKEQIYSDFADTVKENEYGKSVRLTDDSAIKQIKELAQKYAALTYNGSFHASDIPGMLDGTESHTFYMKLSEGTAVEMSGYNCSPNGYRDFSVAVMRIFEDIVKSEEQ